MPDVVCKVSIPNTGRDFFTYQAVGEPPLLGARVWVPFRKKERQLGVVVGFELPQNISFSLKTIERVIDAAPLFPQEILDLCQWVSAYYHAPLSEILVLALPKFYRRGDARYVHQEETYYQLSMNKESAFAIIKSNAKRQKALVDWLFSEAAPKTLKMMRAAGFSATQWSFLLTHRIIKAVNVTYSVPKLEKPLLMNSEQIYATTEILESLHQYQCFLLQGVTGSGKTEVYLQVIAKVLENQQQVLVLVPEIGLTPQLLSRFQERFHVSMAVIHSHLNDTERLIAWQNASDDKVRLVIGTRSAVFVPMPSLGLIVVDEEHDASLKQMDGVRYFARDTALMRAHLKNIPIVLGSATPSLESLYNCMRNKYQLLRLNQKAISQNPLHYHILDIRNQTLQDGLAEKTIEKIRAHLAQENQVLVFINRRGFAPVLLCHQCGWMADCKACDSHLTLHRSTNRLICHHCGLGSQIPNHCYSCKAKQLIPIGVGTQRIHESLSHLFPKTNIVRIDRDVVRSKAALDLQLDQINRGEAELIIGTQMLAKGHHFPRLTLVVVLEADNGFYNQDFRAIEQLGQLLIQVAGRAGRAHIPGEVVIQTHLPHHPLLNQLIQKGYDAFAEAILEMRHDAKLPPYHFLAVIRVQGRLQAILLQVLHALKDLLKGSATLALGPAPAPLARKAHHYRMQLLLKSATRKDRDMALMKIRDWFSKSKQIKGVRWSVDVDPMDLS